MELLSKLRVRLVTLENGFETRRYVRINRCHQRGRWIHSPYYCIVCGMRWIIHEYSSWRLPRRSDSSCCISLVEGRLHPFGWERGMNWFSIILLVDVDLLYHYRRMTVQYSTTAVDLLASTCTCMMKDLFVILLAERISAVLTDSEPSESPRSLSWHNTVMHSCPSWILVWHDAWSGWNEEVMFSWSLACLRLACLHVLCFVFFILLCCYYVVCVQCGFFCPHRARNSCLCCLSLVVQQRKELHCPATA